MRVRYKKEHTIQFTKVQYFCHYAKKMGGFYVIKRGRVKRGGVRNIRRVRKLEKLGRLGRLGDYGKYHVSSIVNLPKLLKLPKLHNLPNLPKSPPPNFLSECHEISSISTTTNFRVRVGLICCRLRERADGTYMAYFPFALWIEGTK